MSDLIYTNVNGQRMFLNNAGSRALSYVDPYNPLDLPPNTIRVRTSNGNPPAKGSSTSYETATLVPGTNDVYDVYKSGTSMYRVLYYSTNVVEVILYSILLVLQICDLCSASVLNLHLYHCTILLK